MQEALLRCAFERLTPCCARDVSNPWRQCCEDRFQSLHRGAVAANHQARAPFDYPDSPAGADIEIIDPRFLEVRVPANIVFVNEFPPSIMVLPRGRILPRAATVLSVASPAGTISQITFGEASAFTRSANEDVPVAPSLTIAFTLSAP